MPGVREDNVTEHLLRSLFPHGKRRGSEFLVGDLAGNPGESLKISMSKGVWCDFSTGQAGKGYGSLVRASKGIVVADTPMPERKREEWAPCVSSPIRFFQIPSHYKYGTASQTWQYMTADNRQSYGVVCRFDHGEGKKDVIPYVPCRNSFGQLEWRWHGFAKPRPLYRLQHIGDNESVMLVEGEKTSDAAQKFFAMPVLSWPGGSNAVRHVDFSPIAHKRVFVWPDNDEAGMKAAQAIRRALPQARIIRPPADMPKGWDLADCDWSKERVLEYAIGNLFTPSRLVRG